MAPPARAEGAFPSGTYGKYKRATAFFLHWLLRARAISSATDEPERADQRQPLDVYERIVGAIARAPAQTLTPALLQLWPRALSACQAAITLRARVALFFPRPTAGDSHAHFLNRLRKWHKTLREAASAPAEHPGSKGEKPSVDFGNYYAVLALPDDYFSDEGEEEEETTETSAARSLSAADRKRLFDAAFAEDLCAELACLFMELDELLEGVYSVYLDVKREKKTLIEATAVAKIAIDSATRVIARLQVLYPSIQDGEDISTLIKDHLSLEELSRLVTRVENAWVPTHGEIKYQYEPGTVLVDILWVARALARVAVPLTENPGMRLGANHHGHGKRYHEDLTPEYVVPELGAMPHFFAQQIPILVNLLVTRRVRGIPVDPNTLDGWFLAPIQAFCLSGNVTIPLVFRFMCWTRSVAALQGKTMLGRTTGLSLFRRWDLQDRIQATMAHGVVERSSAKLQDELDITFLILQTNDHEIGAVRHNPIFAGCVLLDSMCMYLREGHNAIQTTPRLRAVCHMYSALRDRRLLDEIPFFEDIIRLYGRFLFTPSRAAAQHGTYARSYGTFSAQPTQSAFRDVDVSHVVRLLCYNDYSVLPATVGVSSWKNLLEKVALLCEHELFHTRFLSRDMLQLNDDLSDFFNDMCKTLDRQSAIDMVLAENDSHMPTRDRLSFVKVKVVMTPLMEMLDCLNHDGTVRVTDETRELLGLDARGAAEFVGPGMSGGLVRYCRDAAKVVARRFGGRSVETRYFTLPSTPAWASLEFGGPAWDEKNVPDQKTLKVFQTLMKMLESATAPLSGAKLAELKWLVVANPAVVTILYNHKEVALGSLLHHAAAGPANDHRLVEWLIQMGALKHQSMHCHDEKEAALLGHTNLCNGLAVHCAAEKGNVGMVRLLVEASNMRDLDMLTYHTKESLMHIAVRTGNRPIFEVLSALNADVTRPTGSGKHTWQLTRDPAWRRIIQQMAEWQRQQNEAVRNHQSRGAQFKAAADAQSEALREALQRQRDVEHAGKTETPRAANTSAASGQLTDTSKKNKKKAKKKQATNNPTSRPASDAVLSAKAEQAMEKLAVKIEAAETLHGAATSSVGPLEQLTTALDALKEDAMMPRAARESHARVAVDILEKMATTVTNLMDVGAILDLAKIKKEALDASEALFRLDTFHAQLPAQHKYLYPSTSTTTAFDRLARLAGQDPPGAFLEFFLFAGRTAIVLAQICASARAGTVLELLERRMLALSARDAAFRILVLNYTVTRKECGLSPALGSTLAVRRELVWFSRGNQGKLDAALLSRLDRLRGRRAFLRLDLAGEQRGAYDAFKHAMDAHAVAMDWALVYFGDQVVGATHARSAYAALEATVLAVAARVGLRFREEGAVRGAATLVMMSFEFGAAGIYPERGSIVEKQIQ